MPKFSIEDTMKRLDERIEWDEKHPILAFFRDIPCLPYRIKITTKQTWLDIRAFCVRGRKGWHYSDVWSFDSYLSKVISQGVKHLKTHKMGYPTGIAETEEEALKKWENILDEIIWSFDQYNKCSVGDLSFYIPKPKNETEENWKNWIDNHEKKYRIRIMSKEEDERMRNGMKLFIEYYSSLWD